MGLFNKKKEEKESELREKNQQMFQKLVGEKHTPKPNIPTASYENFDDLGLQICKCPKCGNANIDASEIDGKVFGKCEKCNIQFLI